jgi:hypothetical protein
MKTSITEKQKKSGKGVPQHSRAVGSTQRASAQAQTEISDTPAINDRQLPVFNPNRWLWDFEIEKPKRMSSPNGPVRRRNLNQMMMWNLISSVMDFLFISLVCVTVLWVFGRALDTNVRNTFIGLWKISPTGTVFLFYSFLWVYHVAMPALVSYTPGQWACQITRTPREISFSWIMKATFRLLVLFMTGFMILPLFSWASGTDLEASLSGLKLEAR